MVDLELATQLWIDQARRDLEAIEREYGPIVAYVDLGDDVIVQNPLRAPLPLETALLRLIDDLEPKAEQSVEQRRTVTLECPNGHRGQTDYAENTLRAIQAGKAVVRCHLCPEEMEIVGP